MINEKELIKQIKKSKHTMIWTIKDGVNYITNRHWMARYKTVPQVVLTTLFSIFAQIPKEGQALVMSCGITLEQKYINCGKMYDDAIKGSQGIVTSYIKESGNILMRVIKYKGDYLYLNNDFFKIADDDYAPKCNGKLAPLLFCDDDLLLLPYIVENDDETIKELVAV
jgi:hypothetical protein